MSGNLRLVEIGMPAAKHEHVDIELESGLALRYTDPRRFGAMLWSLDPLNHELLIRLGPEPLTDLFDGECLFQLSRRRSEEHTSELPSLIRISYAVFCLKKKTTKTQTQKSNLNT